MQVPIKRQKDSSQNPKHLKVSNFVKIERQKVHRDDLERATLPHWIHLGLLRPRRFVVGVTAAKRPLLVRDGDGDGDGADIFLKGQN